MLVPLAEESQYYKRYKINYKVELSELRLIDKAEKNWRTRLIETGKKNITPRYCALVLGVVLGTSELLPQEQKKILQAVGLSHMLAASGFHLASLAGLCILVGRSVFKVNKRHLSLIIGFISFFYAHLANWTPSITRAFFMLSLYLVATILGRPCWNWRFLLIVLSGVLIYEPHLWEDVGLQLSFLAVGGIFLWFLPLQNIMRFLPKLVATSLSLSISSMSLIGPLLLLYFGQFATSFCLAGLCIAPLLEGVFFLSWPCIIPINLGPITKLSAHLCAQLCEWTLLLSGKFVKALPSIQLSPPSPTIMILYYIFILLLRLAYQPTRRQADLLDNL